MPIKGDGRGKGEFKRRKERQTKGFQFLRDQIRMKNRRKKGLKTIFQMRKRERGGKETIKRKKKGGKREGKEGGPGVDLVDDELGVGAVETALELELVQIDIGIGVIA